MVEKSGEFAIEVFLIRRCEVSHNLIVSQKLRASTSKKRSLYRTALSSVQIVVYLVNYCLGIFPSKVFHHGTMYCDDFPTWKVVLVHLPVVPSERDGTVVSPSEDGLRRWGTRRDCKGDVEYSPNIL